MSKLEYYFSLSMAILALFLSAVAFLTSDTGLAFGALGTSLGITANMRVTLMQKGRKRA